MKLNMGGYLKLGSAGGIAGVFITDPSEPEPEIPKEDIPNALTDETGAFLLDDYGRNLTAEQ
jgi:hypothetical protein